MLKKTISYTDYNGTQRTEDFYFNLNKAEVVEMEVSAEGNSLGEYLQKIVKENNGRLVMAQFKEIIVRAYGRKTLDGKRFEKSPAISEEFLQSEAYSELIVELLTKEDEAAAFIKGLLPADLSQGSSEAARERSQQNMQGFLKKEASTTSVVEDLPQAAPQEDLIAVTPQQKPLTPVEIEALKQQLAANGVQL